MKGNRMKRTPRPTSRWLLASLLVPLALLASACLPAGVRIAQNPVAAALERKVGLIAYLSTDGNIYTIDQGGGRKIQITHDAYISDTTFLFYGLPTWSPDSQSLAFVSYAGTRGQNPSSMGLYTAPKDGKGVTQALTSTQPVVYFSWSPDNRHVSFISATDNSNLAFQVIGADGAKQQLVDAGSPYYWAWAPDGHTVLAHNGAHLSLLQVGDSVSERALSFDAQAFRAPAFSPNGKQMLVAAISSAGQSALLLADAQGQNVKALTTETFGNIAFNWSPDGQRVAYLTSDSGAAGSTGHLVWWTPAARASRWR